jgi:hypothetical protein
LEGVEVQCASLTPEPNLRGGIFTGGDARLIDGVVFEDLQFSWFAGD